MPYTDPKKKKQYDLDYYEKHRKKLIDRAKKHYVSHKESRLKYIAQWQKDNADKHRAYTAKYQKSHREQYNTYYQVRRTRLEGTGGSYTSQQWEGLMNKCHKKCLCCGRRRRLTADHVVPVSKGGTSSVGNIQPLCGPCNSSKGTKSTDYR